MSKKPAPAPAGDALPQVERRRYQRGALRRERKRWMLRLRVDVPGEPARRREKRICVGTVADLPTRALARRAADALLPALNPTRSRSAEAMTLAGFAPIYLADSVSMMKPASARSMRSIVNRHLVPLLGHYRLELISGRVPQQFVAKLHARKLSRSSICNVLLVLRLLLDVAVDQGYPCTRFGRRSFKLPPEQVELPERHFTPAELQAILAGAELPWRVLYALMGYLGLRAGEALGLAWEHIDFAAGLVSIRQAVVLGRIQTLKSKHSRAELPLIPALREILAEYRLAWRANPHGLLFASVRGTPLWADSVRRYHFAPLLKRLGLPPGGFHAFRHGAATNLFAAGAQAPTVRAMMRHADLKTTMGYTHVVLGDQRAAAEAAGALIAAARPPPRPGGG